MIKESSELHFMIHSKDMRIVFFDCADDFEIELYINESSDGTCTHNLTDLSNEKHLPFASDKDPNGIAIIISHSDACYFSRKKQNNGKG